MTKQYPGGISNHADDIEPFMAHGATKCAIWLKDLEMYLKEMLWDLNDSKIMSKEKERIDQSHKNHSKIMSKEKEIIHQFPRFK